MSDPTDSKAIADSIRQDAKVPPAVREGLAQAVEYFPSQEASGIKSALDGAVKATEEKSPDMAKQEVHSLAAVLVISIEQQAVGGADTDKFIQPLTAIIGHGHDEEIKRLMTTIKSGGGFFQNDWDERVKASTALRALIEQELPATLAAPAPETISGQSFYEKYESGMQAKEKAAAIEGIKNEAGVTQDAKDGLAETAKGLSSSHAKTLKSSLDKAVSGTVTTDDQKKATIKTLADEVVSGLNEAVRDGIDLGQFADPLAKLSGSKHTPEEIKGILDTWKSGEAVIAESGANGLLENIFPSVFTPNKEKLDRGTAIETDAKEMLRRTLVEGLNEAVVPATTPAGDGPTPAQRTR